MNMNKIHSNTNERLTFSLSKKTSALFVLCWDYIQLYIGFLSANLLVNRLLVSNSLSVAAHSPSSVLVDLVLR